MPRALTATAALAAIEAALRHERQNPYVPPHTDPRSIEVDLRAHLCEPFEVQATVMSPGFPFADPGAQLVGLCVAHHAGYWLIYQPEEQRFLCFWGESPTNLGAHGVYGNPLYCWAA
jgi:hypothetical protein